MFRSSALVVLGEFLFLTLKGSNVNKSHSATLMSGSRWVHPDLWILLILQAKWFRLRQLSVFLPFALPYAAQCQMQHSFLQYLQAYLEHGDCSCCSSKLFIYFVIDENKLLLLHIYSCSINVHVFCAWLNGWFGPPVNVTLPSSYDSLVSRHLQLSMQQQQLLRVVSLHRLKHCQFILWPADLLCTGLEASYDHSRFWPLCCWPPVGSRECPDTARRKSVMQPVKADVCWALTRVQVKTAGWSAQSVRAVGELQLEISSSGGCLDTRELPRARKST